MADRQIEVESANEPLEEPRCFTETHGIITTTMVDIPGYRVVKVLGTVYGLSVRARNIVTGSWSVMKAIAGGELKASTTYDIADSRTE